MEQTGLGNMNLKVAPEKIYTKAQDMAKRTRKMQKQFESFKDVVGNTQKYWVGDAGTVHRKSNTELYKNMEQFIVRFDQHVDALYKVASNYMDVEKKIQETVTTLPINIIE